ncbi:hypothetical protein ACFQX6_62710 [Streptosporangium lutulentum]
MSRPPVPRYAARVSLSGSRWTARSTKASVTAITASHQRARSSATHVTSGGKDASGAARRASAPSARAVAASTTSGGGPAGGDGSPPVRAYRAIRTRARRPITRPARTAATGRRITQRP